MPRRKEPKIPDAILDQLLAGADAKTAFDPGHCREAPRLLPILWSPTREERPPLQRL
jgi:hypothetical protein